MAKQHKGPTPNVENDATGYPRFTMASSKYAHNLYKDTVDGSEVEDYLRTTEYFDSETGRWFFSYGSSMKEPFVLSVGYIVRSVMRRFSKSNDPGVERRVINAHGAPGNDMKGGHSLYSDLVIRASGPSFGDPCGSPRTNSFFNIASCILVKLDLEVGTAESNVKEMERYARYIFAYQPNRFFVRTMVITENHVRLVHFDRAGAQTTSLIDIHQHPATFVRLIAGITSANERLLGLDDSVQWTIIDGRKAQGTVTTTAPDGTLKAYHIVERIKIPFVTYLGRGTACWRVRDPDTSEEFVIKDSWRPKDRPSEHEFLKLFDETPGVVHMVSYETGRGETKDYRCASTLGQYPNRVSMRIMMKSYGKSVQFFTSVLQLLCAIRDAIAGHQRLSGGNLRILHRDISHNNILIGGDGAREGCRGILIDLDMAFRATDEQPTIDADHNIASVLDTGLLLGTHVLCSQGTRIFQSICVLDTFSPRYKTPAHDYLEDLESFFYVVVLIFLIYRPDGSRVSGKEEGPSIVGKWGNHDDPSLASADKNSIFCGTGDDATMALKVIEGAWGPVCAVFYKRFKSWISDMKDEKSDILMQGVPWYRYLRGDQDEEEVDEALKTFLSSRDEHYSQVLGIFDDAIEALKSPSTSDKAPVSPPPLDEHADASGCPTSDGARSITPSTEVASLPNTEGTESVASTSLQGNFSRDATPSTETTTTTLSSSLEAPALAAVPPAAPSTSAANLDSDLPNSRLKRRADDVVHRQSPPGKRRRVTDGHRVTGSSPK